MGLGDQLAAVLATSKCAERLRRRDRRRRRPPAGRQMRGPAESHSDVGARHNSRSRHHAVGQGRRRGRRSGNRRTYVGAVKMIRPLHVAPRTRPRCGISRVRSRRSFATLKAAPPKIQSARFELRALDVRQVRRASGGRARALIHQTSLPSEGEAVQSTTPANVLRLAKINASASARAIGGPTMRAKSKRSRATETRRAEVHAMRSFRQRTRWTRRGP